MHTLPYLVTVEFCEPTWAFGYVLAKLRVVKYNLNDNKTSNS